MGKKHIYNFSRYFLSFIIILFFSFPTYTQVTSPPNPNSNKKPVKKVDYSKRKLIELIRSSNTQYLSFEEGRNGILIFRGGVVVKIGTDILHAETVKYNPDSGELYGEGLVTFQTESQKIEGEQFIYDNNTGQGVMYNGRSNSKPLFYFGEQIQQIKPNTFLLTKATFTSCDLPNPHFLFDAKKMWIYPNNRVAAFSILYKVGKTNVFYIPFLFQNQFGTGILTAYGYNDTQGHFLQNTYYISIPPVTGKLSPYFFFTPQDSKLIFDIYQYAGQNFGTLLRHKSKQLFYNFDLAAVNYQVSNRICEATTGNNACKQIVSNVIKKEDGTIGRENQFWWKINGILKANWINWTNVYSYINTEFKHYRHQNYESEFGTRREPNTTLDILWLTPILVKPPTYSLVWKAEYGLNWKGTHFDIQIQRNLLWFQNTTFKESNYLPQLDILPAIHFSQNWQIIKPAKKYYAGAWLSYGLNGDIIRFFEQPANKVFKNTYRGDARITNTHQFYFSNWLTFSPSVSYGLNYQTITPNNDSFKLESQRLSYHYIETNNPLKLGLYWLYFLAEYRYSLRFLNNFPDPTFGLQGPHLINLSANANYENLLFFNVKTSRDLRVYPYPIPELYKWAPIEVYGEFRKEFLNLRYSPKKPSLYLTVINRYRYLLRYQTSETNDTTVSMVLGNMKIPPLKRLNKLYTTLGWRHNFIDKRQSFAYLRFGINIEFHRDWRFILDLDSAGEELYRYGEGSTFVTDVFNSFNFINPNPNSVFNIKNFVVSIEHSLHDWVIRISYERHARNSLWGTNLQNKVSFFEQGVFFSMNLANFNLFKPITNQVYRSNAADILLQ